MSIFKDRALPIVIPCHECGQSFDFLPSHLPKHRITTNKYRQENGIEGPLFSLSYSEHRSESAKKQNHIPRVAANWHEYRKIALLDLEKLLIEQGTLPIDFASEITGIPKTTLYSATRGGRLNAVTVTPVSLVNGLVRRTTSAHMIGVPIEDLRDFRINYRPKA